MTLIGVPCMDTLPVDYVNSIMRLEKPPGTKIVHLPLSLVYVSREQIVRHSIDEGFDHVLFVDSDMVFPADALMRLLAHDKDVVSGACYTRRSPHHPCFYKTISKAKCEPLMDYPKGLVEVDGVGGAFVLIKTKVFSDIYESGQLCYFPTVGLGEDIAFCVRARDVGYKIYVDTTLQIGHIGTRIYGEGDFLCASK